MEYMDSQGRAVAHDEVLTPLWTVYAAVVLASLCLQALSSGAMLFAGVAACRRRRRRRAGAGKKAPGSTHAGPPVVLEPVAAVVPCYLPNEASIIKDTVKHLLHELVAIESLDVHIVYNTPCELPIEAELRDMAAGPLPQGRRLLVERVPGSRSKAENLNHVIPQLTAKYVALYDADHQPDPGSLALAVSHLQATGMDCVQGSTYIREGFFLLRELVRAEFFVTYFVTLPAMEAVAGSGFFGGANGVWLGSSLRRLHFDAGALTEDIDCFIRAVLQHGLTFAFLPECCSGELLPAGLGALWRQRLRWAMGWDQATLRHAPSFWRAALPVRKRVGLYYMFVCRWITQLFVVITVLVNTRQQLEPCEAVPLAVARLQTASFCLYVAMVASALLAALWHQPGLRLPLSLMLYFAVLPVYVLFNTLLLTVSLLRLASGNTGAWVVTTRAQASKARISAVGLEAGDGGGTGSLEEPLLGKDGRRRDSTLCLLALAFLAQGTVVGLVVGYLCAQRTVVHPLWGWVPFNLGATTTTYTDGRVVATGMAVGTGSSLLVLVAIQLLRWALRPRTGRRSGC